MSIRQVYDTQADVPAGLQEHFVERDGKWFLQADPPIEDVSALKGALEKERGLRRETEKSLSDMKIQFEGVDADEYRKLQDRVKGLDESEIYDRQGIEALVTRRTESMKAEHERQISSKDRELTQLRAKAEEFDHRWRQDRIKTALLEAVNKHGVYDKAVDDAVRRGLSVFTDLDETGQPVSKNGSGFEYGKDGINPLRPEEWISTLKTSGQAPHLWPPSSGGGAPAHHGGNSQGVDWSKLPPAERLTAFRAQQEASRNR